MNKIKDKYARSWLLKQVRPARFWLILSMLLGLANGLLLLGQAGLLAGLIHQLVMEQMPRSALLSDFLLTAFLVLLRGGCHWGREVCGYSAGVKVRQLIRNQLLNKLQRLGPMVIAEQPAGSWSAIVVEQVEELQDFVARYLPQMFLAVSIPLVLLVVIIPQSWVVGMIFLVTAPLIPMFMIFVGGKAAEANRRNFEALSRLGGFFLDRLEGLETLKMFSRAEAAARQLDHASEEFRVKTMQVLKLAFLSSMILEFFASISIALVAVYLGMNFLGYVELGGPVSLYTGLFLLLLAPEFYQPLRELGTYYHAKAKAIGAAQEIINILSREEVEQHCGTNPVPDTSALTIEAQQLTVVSPQTSEPLLDGLNFTIPAGSRLAIIGASGAGKSTLVNTLMGFWPYQGQLTVGGQSLAETSLAQWRQQIAWLGQQPLIIQGTVYDNIAFGRELSREQCLKALARAQGMDILDKLPLGMDSPLQERGGNLSLGQAQRIALARAIALPVKCLILDEPTASLDADSEAKVQQVIRLLPNDCTVITITHRLSPLESMDQIIMLDNRRIIAQGAPAQLAAESPQYQAFVHSRKRSLDHE